MRRYPKYEDSSIPWLGKIPSHWRLLPSRAIVENQVQKNEGGEIQEYLSLMANIGIIRYEDKGDVGNKKPDDLAKCKIVRRGNLVINSMNYAIGSYGMSPYDGVCSPVYIVLEPNQKIVERRFALRLFENKSMQKHLAMLGNGILEHRAAIKWDDIKPQHVPIPPLNEQKAILEFLDRETARIDNLVAEKQTFIKLLKEKRQALISHPFRSDIKRVHAKLGYYVELLPGYAFKSELFSENSSDVRLLRGANVSVGSLKWDDVVYWRLDNSVDVEAFALQEGDIVFGMDRPWITAGARTAIVKASDLPCYLVQRVARIRAKSKVNQKYIYYALSSHEFKAHAEADLTGLSVPHISPDQIKSFPLPVLTEEEQTFLVEKIERDTSRIDKIIEEVDQSITLTLEHRTALISTAVTGKIDVRSEVLTSLDQPHTQESAHA